MASWVDGNKSGRGLIGTPVDDQNYGGSFSTTNTTKYLSSLISINNQFEKSKETGGVGPTERIISEGNNIILMNPL